MLSSVWKKLVRGVGFRTKKASTSARAVNTNDHASEINHAINEPSPPNPSFSAPLKLKRVPPPVFSPDEKPLPAIPTRRNRSVRFSALSSHRKPMRKAAAPPATERPSSGVSSSTLWRNVRFSTSSSARSTTGSHYPDPSGARHKAVQTPSTPRTLRYRLRKRFGVAFPPTSAANGVANATRSSSSSDSRPSSRSRVLPVLVRHNNTAVLCDTSLPSTPKQGPEASIRLPGWKLTTERTLSVPRQSSSRQQKTFSHYLKVETIASGGSGEVCKVTRKSPDGEIVRAVKLLDLAEDNAPFVFYTQEIRILRALLDQQIYYGRSDEDEEAEEKHHGLKHVVRLSPQAKFIGVCAKRYLYIVMEYYPGSLVAFQGHVAQDELALRFIISQVTHGLNFLHSIGIIHMDLKTHNIFVSRKGNCIIGDFGGSSYDPKGTGHTWAGAYTPGFVAPEARIKLPQSVTPLCDFWSLGVTIYVLVVDHDQFGQEETHVQLGLVAMKMAERMEIYGCPREIWYIVNGMCQSRPKDRWGGQKILDYLRRNFE